MAADGARNNFCDGSGAGGVRKGGGGEGGGLRAKHGPRHSKGEHSRKASTKGLRSQATLAS